MSRVLRLMSILGMAASLVLLGSAPQALAADPHGAVARPAPGPPPTIEDEGVGCNVFGIGTFKTDLSTPERVEEGIGPSADGPLRGNGVAAKGYVDVFNNTSCSQAKVKFQLETKVCNRWGQLCSWRTIREGEWHQLPIQGRIDENLTGKCRSGVDTYKLTAIVSHVEASFEQTPRGNWVPYLETKSDDFHSDEIKLDCG